MPMNDQTNAPVVVTQADRELADWLGQQMYFLPIAWFERMSEGEHDNSDIMQRLARHRIAAQPAPQADEWTTLEAENAALKARVAEAAELLEIAQGHIAIQHDEGCELDPEYGEARFDERMEDEDPDGERGDRWPKDAKCTCGSEEFVARIDGFSAALESQRHD